MDINEARQLAGESMQYIGARYVPKFYRNSVDPDSIEWEANVAYEPITVVTYLYDSYTSKIPVPATVGNPADNSHYWARTGQFNAAIAALQEEMRAVKLRVTDLETQNGNEALQTDAQTLSGGINELHGDIVALDLKIDTTKDDLQAKIYNKGVSYTDFGAKMDGVTDDSAAVISAHAYAKTHGVPIVQHGGVLKANFQVTDIDYDMDLDFTLIVDDNTVQPVYKMVHDNGLVNHNYLGTFAHADNSYNVDALKGKFFVAKAENVSDALIGENVTAGADYYHAQPMMIDKNGRLITSNYFLTSVTTNFVLAGYSDISEKAIVIKGLHVKNETTKQGIPFVFEVYRNNVTIKDVTIDAPALTVNNANEALIHVAFCCNVNIFNVNGFSNSDGNEPTYIVTAYGVANLTIKDCVLVNGWHTVSTSVIDGYTIENCVGMSFDNHWGIFGKVMVLNCKVNDPVGYINLGYGDASVLISHLVENIDSSRIVIFRRDLPIGFSGNLTVESCDGERAIAVGAGTYSGSTGALNPNIPTQASTIRISHCKLRQPFSIQADLYGQHFVITVDNCIFVSTAVPKIGMLGDMGGVKQVIINNCYYDGYLIAGGRCKFSDCVLKNCEVKYNIEQCTIDSTSVLPSTGFFKDCYFPSKPTRNATSDVLHLINCWSNNVIAFEAGTNVRTHDCWNITSA